MPEANQNLEQKNIDEVQKIEKVSSNKNQKEKLLNPEQKQKKEILENDNKKDDAKSSQQVLVPHSQQEEDKLVNNALKETVDNILEEGLGDIYLNMSTTERRQFKKKGEETTNTIVELLTRAKIKVNKIVQAIITWLKMIPSVNKFFIRQTAKIKTDKILAAREKEISEK